MHTTKGSGKIENRNKKSTIMILLIFVLSLLFLIISLILNHIAVAEILPSDRARILQAVLVSMVGIVGAMVVCLLIFLMRTVRKENLTREEQLGQVRYMLEVEKKLFDAYRKPELFMEALHRVALTMSAKETYFMVLDGSSILRVYRWDGEKGVDSGEITGAYLEMNYPYLTNRGREEGSQILYDLEELKKANAPDYEYLKNRGIENIIFTSVRDLDRKTVGILGAVNMNRKWKNAKRLECVALSFGMALNNRKAFETVKRMGETDFLTGLLNRNSFLEAKKHYGSGSFQNLACVFVDVDGLHELNNHLGHAAGDAMLVWIAKCLKRYFGGQDLYRVGGDEFLAVCRDMEENDVNTCLASVLNEVEAGGYHVSVGMEWREDSFAIEEMTGEAERKMYEEKHRYYEEKGDVKRAREMNRVLEGILREKKDADAFLAVLASNFSGVYFVNMNRDSIRSIYIPEYFKEMLKRARGKYSAALESYIEEMVAPECQGELKWLLDYEALSKSLEKEEKPKLAYKKKDGKKMILRIYRSADYSEANREMIWLFQNREDA